MCVIPAICGQSSRLTCIRVCMCYPSWRLIPYCGQSSRLMPPRMFVIPAVPSAHSQLTTSALILRPSSLHPCMFVFPASTNFSLSTLDVPPTTIIKPVRSSHNVMLCAQDTTGVSFWFTKTTQFEFILCLLSFAAVLLYWVSIRVSHFLFLRNAFPSRPFCPCRVFFFRPAPSPARAFSLQRHFCPSLRGLLPRGPAILRPL